MTQTKSSKHVDLSSGHGHPSSAVFLPPSSSARPPLTDPPHAPGIHPKNQSEVYVKDNPTARPLSQPATKPSQHDSNVTEPVRRLIPRILAEPGAPDAYDEQAWYKKVYGPDIVVVSTVGVPDGWIMVDDPHPPTKKIKKRWNRFDPPSADPNARFNNDRARYGLPPVDRWNIGFDYIWDEKDLR